MNKKQKNKAIFEMKKKNPMVATGLSLILVGAGQMYNGQVGKGLLYLFLCMISWIVLMGWVWWIISTIQAYRGAKEANKLLALELDLDYNEHTNNLE